MALRINHLIGFGVGGVKPVLTKRTNPAVDTTNTNSYTFGSIDVGTEPDTLVIIAAHGAGGGTARTLSSMTIDGGAGSIAVQANAGASDPGVAIVSREIDPSGLISVTVNWSGNYGRCSIGVWTINKHRSATAHATGNSTSGGNVAPEIPSSGFGIYGATGGAAAAMTWTAATERYDDSVEAASQHSGADYSAAATESPTVSATNDSVIVGATWR